MRSVSSGGRAELRAELVRKLSGGTKLKHKGIFDFRVTIDDLESQRALFPNRQSLIENYQWVILRYATIIACWGCFFLEQMWLVHVKGLHHEGIRRIMLLPLCVKNVLRRWVCAHLTKGSNRRLRFPAVQNGADIRRIRKENEYIQS